MSDNLKSLIVGALLAAVSAALGFAVGARINQFGNVEYALLLLSQEQARHRQTVEAANREIERLQLALTTPQTQEQQ